jgi:hypothetical protein
LTTRNDTTEEIRKRLGATRSKVNNQNTPSVLVWKTPVRNWLREACLQEKQTLGPHTLREINSSNGIRWTLSFVSSQRELAVVLRPSNDKSHLVLSLSAEVPEQLTIPVLEIFENGPQIDTTEALRQLSSNILYMFDL